MPSRFSTLVGSDETTLRMKHEGLNVSTAGGLLALVLWSTTMAMARSLSERLGPVRAASAVYVVAGVICLIRLKLTKTSISVLLKIPRKYLYGCGCLFVSYAVLIYLAVGLASDRQQMLEVGLINYLWPASTILFSLVLLNKRASLGLLPGTALALLGLFLVMTQSARISWSSFVNHLATNPVAYSMAFAAAIVWALYSNLARRWSEPGGGGAVDLFIPATGIVLVLMRPFAPAPGDWSAQAFAEAGTLGAITALAYSLWDGAMRRGDVLLVAACSYFTPLFSTLISCIYLKVVPGPRLWLGCACIIIGSLFSWRSVSDRVKNSALQTVVPDKTVRKPTG
jgi:drug/metabolite transporter (DMT)-like permease